jgi:peptidoglycan hydrolase-like protein with peptidoglycan-binding domain
LAAVAGSAVILVNAVFLQSGSHPAPFFANPARPQASDVRPKTTALPPVTGRPLSDIIADLQLELTRRGFFDGPVDGVFGAKTDAAIRDFEQRANLKLSSDPTDALLRAIRQSPIQIAGGSTATVRRNDPIADLIGPSPRIMALQRALSDFGYGQIKPSGSVDAATSAAIEKFERERRLPITGQVSERVVRELAAMTGRPLE